MSGEDSKNSQDTEELFAQLIEQFQIKELKKRGLRARVVLESDGLSDDEVRARVEEVLVEARRKQTKAQRLATLGTMGAGIVHEARNVLTAVVGFAQLAQRNGDEERRLQYISTFESETRRALDMLAHFLEFSRNRPKTLNSFDINTPVERAKRATHHQLQVHQIKLCVELADKPIMVLGTSGEIEQVLVNLIMNAQQASSEGDSVRVVVEDDEEAVRISVADTGGGIAPDDIEEIFEPFFTTKMTGTGLGLAICRRIAEEHDGELTVESTKGQGSVFTLRIPRLDFLVARPQK